MSDKFWDFIIYTIWGGIIFTIIGTILFCVMIKQNNEPYHQTKLRGWTAAIGAFFLGGFLILNQFFGFYKKEDKFQDDFSSKISIQKLKEFKEREKFAPDSTVGYPGTKEYKKPIFSEIINHSADNFIDNVENGRGKDFFYREVEICLSAFNMYEVLSEDSVMIKKYMQELLNIVGIPDDDGIFERWPNEDLTISMKYLR